MSTEEDREELARLVDPKAWGEPILPETYRAVSRDESLIRAGAILAAGYRKYSEPEVTYEMVIQAVGAYEDDSDERVYWRSMRAALEAALGVDDR